MENALSLKVKLEFFVFQVILAYTLLALPFTQMQVYAKINNWSQSKETHECLVVFPMTF